MTESATARAARPSWVARIRRIPRIPTSVVAVVTAVTALTSGACQRREPPSPAPPPASAASSAALAPRDGASSASASAQARTSITRRASFTLASTQVRIADARMGTRLDEAARATTTGATAYVAVNGGFFDPDGSPLGLAVSEGKTLSLFSKGMSGGVLSIRDGVAKLTATEDYAPEGAAPGGAAVEFAIQCRPRLVVASRVNIKSDDQKRARRTALCVRDAGRTLDVVVAEGASAARPPTLLEFAQELLATGCEDALNLDGGPSTAWAARGDGGVDVVPPHAGVRHAVVFAPR